MDFSKFYEDLNSHHSETSKNHYLFQLREKNILRFKEMEWPTKKSEEWRYTPLNLILNSSFQLPRPIVGLNDILQWPEIAPWISEHENRLVFLNGYFCNTLSSMEKDKILVMPLSDFVFNNFDKDSVYDPVANYLKIQLSKESSDPFYTLNQALFYEASLIWIPENIILTKPIHILHILKGAELVSHPRTFIVVGERASATINESHFATDSENCFSNSIINIDLGNYAKLNFSKSYAGNSTSLHTGSVSVDVRKQNQLHLFGFSTRGALAKHKTHVTIQNKESEIYLSGIYLCKEKDHTNNHIIIDHQVGGSLSLQKYKGILTDASRAVFNGKVIVEKGAALTQASQINKNLILSSMAEVDTRPQLEIYNHDVKCSHGATVGQLNEDELFYFQSRGIDKDLATEMLARSFVEEIFFDLPDYMTSQRVRALAQNFFCGLKWNKME